VPFISCARASSAIPPVIPPLPVRPQPFISPETDNQHNSSLCGVMHFFNGRDCLSSGTQDTRHTSVMSYNTNCSNHSRVRPYIAFWSNQLLYNWLQSTINSDFIWSINLKFMWSMLINKLNNHNLMYWVVDMKPALELLLEDTCHTRFQVEVYVFCCVFNLSKDNLD